MVCSMGIVKFSMPLKLPLIYYLRGAIGLLQEGDISVLFFFFFWFILSPFLTLQSLKYLDSVDKSLHWGLMADNCLSI